MYYSIFDKILHRKLLGQNSLTDFMLSRLQRFPSNEKSLRRHVFISGLARSGTTALLYTLDQSNVFGSIRYKHMPFTLYPPICRFIDSRYKKNEKKQQERPHKDGIFYETNSPECLDEVYWQLVMNAERQKYICPQIPSSKLLSGYACLLAEFCVTENRDRMLVKNNNNSVRLLYLANFFPNSIFLVPFRSPIHHSKSLLKQHQHFCELQQKDPFVLEYMNLLGHNEFGLNAKPFVRKKDLKEYNKNSINYWLSQWLEIYQWLFETGAIDLPNVYPICYEDFASNVSLRRQIFEMIGVEPSLLNQSGFQFVDKNKYSSVVNEKIDNCSLTLANRLYDKLRTAQFSSLVV